MNPQNIKEFMGQIKESYRVDLQGLFDIQKNLFEYANTIMHNLALGSGTLAAGALILLGSDIPTYKEPIMIGIVLLLVTVFGIFFYLFHYHGRNVNSLIEYRRTLISPVADLLASYDDLEEGNISQPVFEEKLRQVAKDRTQSAKNKNLMISKNNGPENYWDVVFISLLGLGLLFIAVGLISPYL